MIKTQPQIWAISIHALRGEGDIIRAGIMQSTNGISIHALRGEGDFKSAYCRRYPSKFQSTPSVGRATCSHRLASPPQIISIHALRGEGDGALRRRQHIKKKFQSTPSVGRATGDGVLYNRDKT